MGILNGDGFYGHYILTFIAYFLSIYMNYLIVITLRS